MLTFAANLVSGLSWTICLGNLQQQAILKRQYRRDFAALFYFFMLARQIKIMAEYSTKFTLLDNRRIEKQEWQVDGDGPISFVLRALRISYNTAHIVVLYVIITILSGTLLLHEGDPSTTLYCASYSHYGHTTLLIES